MTLRKITIDNSASCFPTKEPSEARGIKQNTIKNISPPRKQNKKNSQNYEEFLKNVAASGFGYLK